MSTNDSPDEECGIIGVYAPNEDVSRMAFFGLYALQHRGQEAAGIAVSDGARMRLHKDVGLVSQVFNEYNLTPLKGHYAIGHTRYSTTGSSSIRNAQPIMIETQFGPLAVAHNGNLVNAAELRARVLKRGVGLSSSSDSEVITMMLAGVEGDTWDDRIRNAMPQWHGAYSLVVLTRDGVYAVRDPWAFRPLSVGRLPSGGHAVASESGALRTLGCEAIREVKPGEIITQVSFPVPKRAAYVKFKNPASRFAIVGVFVADTGNGVRVAVTGAGPSVFRQSEMEKALGAKFAPESDAGAKGKSDGLNSDLHASAEYRAHLVGVMAKRAVEAALK